MNTYAKRFNQHDLHCLPLLSDLICHHQFGQKLNDKFHGISYYYADENPALTAVKQQLLSYLPENKRDLFYVSMLVISTPEIPPHIDSIIKTSINFYVKTANAVTRFHKIKDGVNSTFMKLSNQTDGCILDIQCLETVSEFTADEGDVWILDVKQPHSVSCSANENRVAFCLQTVHLNFNEVCALFEK